MTVNKDNFYKRLEKIESKSPKGKKTVKRPRKQATTRTGYGRFAGIGGVILVLLAGGGAGYYFRANLSPVIARVKQSFTGLQAMNTVDPTTPKGDQTPLVPGVLREASLYGGFVHSPAVVSADSQDYLVADVASGFSVSAGSVAPKDLILFDRNTRCEFRAPKRSEKFYSVNLDYGLIKTQVRAFSDTEVVSKLKAFIKWNMNFSYTRNAKLEKYLVSGKINAVDVFVTDTTAPVYLVLQSFDVPVIWNVHTAENVKIAHIAVNSPGASGVVLPVQNTPVEAINFKDFLISDKGNSSQRNAANKNSATFCDARPWRKPKEHWVQWIKADRSDGPYRNQRDTFFEKARAYDKWFRTVFGQGAEENLTEAEAAAHVLLGPLPKQRIPYRPLADSVVHLVRTDHVIVADETESKKQVFALQNAILDRITDGGFDKINPGYMELTQ